MPWWSEGEGTRCGRGLARGRTKILGPEDRPSKLSHALSVLRKRRIGVVMWWSWCVQEERRRGRGWQRGPEIGPKERGDTEEDRGWRKRSYPKVDYRETEKRTKSGRGSETHGEKEITHGTLVPFFTRERTRDEEEKEEEEIRSESGGGAG